jgi:hypothetical protein
MGEFRAEANNRLEVLERAAGVLDSRKSAPALPSADETAQQRSA